MNLSPKKLIVFPLSSIGSNPLKLLINIFGIAQSLFCYRNLHRDLGKAAAAKVQGKAARL